MHLSLSEQTIHSMIKWMYNQSGDRGYHITRFSMYRSLENALANFDSLDKKVLSVSRSKQLGMSVLGLKQCTYVEANYPQASLLDLQYSDEEFDACISDQVLEHIHGDPFKAFEESVRVVKPGGFICHTTCLINEIHEHPHDYWRFTPEGMRLLSENSNCKVINIGGWGNREAWALINGGFRWEGIPRDKDHPLHVLATRNEPAWPISVWVLCQKK